MPDFVECFLHIHEYGRTGLFPTFCLYGYLCLLKKFVMDTSIFPEACLFIVNDVVLFKVICHSNVYYFFHDFC